MKPVRPDPLSLRRTFGIALLVGIAVVSAALAAACGADNAVVGGSCETGFTQCDLVCVDTNDDPNNCGQCGNVCVGVCKDGRCPEKGDASLEDGSRDASRDSRETDKPAPRDTGTKEGSLTDGRPTDGPSSDGRTLDGMTEGAPGDTGGDTADSCTPPFDTNDSCGTCGFACSSTDVCVLGDAGTFQCVPLCGAPLTDCSNVCVDTTDDGDNCGRCGKVCPSGICSASVCQGMTEGDIVVIGDDYNSTATVPSAVRILTNAVFLPTSSPVQLLSFEHYADPASVANVKAILNAEANATGHKIDITVSNTDSDIPTNLTIANYDVLLVYDQEAAAPGILGALGSSWASTLSDFTVAGGVVVSLDGAAGSTQEMWIFDTNAGLLAVSAHTVIPPKTALDVLAGGDVIGHGVVGPYSSRPNSVYFTTTELNGGNVTYVIVDPSAGDAPVVVHKEVP
jgi:hypothetical protein